MQTLTLTKFQETQQDIGPLVKTGLVLETIPALSSHGPWLVGGTVRRVCAGQLPETDLDIMFKNQQQFNDFCGQMRERGATLKDESPQQITFDHNGWDVQAIRAVYSNTLIQTLNKFDFTICQFGFDGTNLVWSDEGMNHLREKKLVFTQTGDHISSMRRAFKYAEQGFFMDTAAVTKFLKSANKQTVEELKATEIKWAGGGGGNPGRFQRRASYSA